MNLEPHHEITATHLQRQAYLYVRQSTLRQVLENTESTKRQYALRERAVALGWPLDRVVVIDSDLGQSGADSDRLGFQQLVAAVGMGEVGVVLGLEVSRLARSSSDWHRLLEICALTDTLILDEDGLYNPGHFNDRLVADSLEADWNRKLRALAAAQEGCERQRDGNEGVLHPEQRQQVMTLVADFPRLWHDPATPQRERKRMVRLLLEDVTLLKADEVIAQLR